MAVRTNKLAAGLMAMAASGVTTVFTCPEGRTAIVKDVLVSNSQGASALLLVTLRTGAVSIGWIRDTVADGSRLRLTGHELVLESGDELRVGSTISGGSVGYWISGSLLLGDPA